MSKSTFETRMNALRVLDYFREHPERHSQGSWFNVNIGEGWNYNRNVEKVEKNLCSTTMCVAGTVVWQQEGVEGLSMFSTGHPNENRNKAERRAAKYLGIDKSAAYVLFIETDDDEAVEVLRRIADGKKNIFKGIGDLEHMYNEYRSDGIKVGED